MSRENPLWGAPRIHGELLKLGIDIGETSASKYLMRPQAALADLANLS
jgi:putative transposase